MVTVTGGHKLERYLADLSRKVATAKKVSIGFPAGATYPDGTSVPMVAAIQEFGAPSRGIPPRPFIRRMIAAHANAWGPQTGAAMQAYDNDAAKSLGAMGLLIADEMAQSIKNLSDPPLAAATIEAKGFSKPLVDTGHMLQSISSWVE